MKQFAGYKIIQYLSNTNLSQIILVEKFNRLFILKRAKTPQFNRFIEREFYILKYLADTGVVPKPLNIGQIKDRLYFVREFINGKPIHEFLKDRDEEFKIEYFIKALYVLYTVHTHGLILRDISPSNFIAGENGNVYLIDTGLAIFFDENDVNREDIYGTFPYIAPEVIHKQHYGFKSDIYALAAVFYEIFMQERFLKARNIDELLIRQSSPEPCMYRIKNDKLKTVLKKDLSFFESDRLPVLTTLRMLKSSPEPTRIFLKKSFLIIFSKLFEKLLNLLSNAQKNVVNIYSPFFYDALLEYIENILPKRLEIMGYKTAVNELHSDIPVSIFHKKLDYLDTMLHKLNSQLIVILSLKPIKLEPTAYYFGFAPIDIREKDISDILGWSVDHATFSSSDIPIYAMLNQKIFATTYRKLAMELDFSTKNIANYIYAERTDIVDYLKQFKYAVKIETMYIELLYNHSNSEYMAFKKAEYKYILNALYKLGFIEYTKSHIILTRTFDTYLGKRGDKMKEAANKTKMIPSSIYDRMEEILRSPDNKNGGLLQNVREIMKDPGIPPSHLGIFLDKLSENIYDFSTLSELVQIKISLGFYKSAYKDMEKIQRLSLKSQDLAIEYAKIALSLGKHQDALAALEKHPSRTSSSLMMYIHAILVDFKKVAEIKENSEYENNAYYYLSLGFYELMKNHNTQMAKNYSIKAGELAENDRHAKVMSEYLYAICLIEEKKQDRALSILKELISGADYALEELLIHYQLGYLTYSSGNALESLYYFEHAYFLARELQDTLFATQATFYLGYIYFNLKKPKLNLAAKYWHYTYKNNRLLDRNLIKFFYREYFDLLVKLGEFDRAETMFNKTYDNIDFFKPQSLADFIYHIGRPSILKKALESPKLSEKQKKAIKKILNDLQSFEKGR